MRGHYRAHPCPHCGESTTRRKHCFSCKSVRAQPGALVHPTSRYEADAAAQMIASLGGVTLEFVACAMGVSRERVRQIQDRALVRLRARLPLVQIDVTDVGGR